MFGKEKYVSGDAAFAGLSTLNPQLSTAHSARARREAGGGRADEADQRCKQSLAGGKPESRDACVAQSQPEVFHRSLLPSTPRS